MCYVMTFREALNVGCISCIIIGSLNLTTTLVDSYQNGRSFDYSVDEYGNVEVSGNLKISILREYFLVEKKDELGNLGLCIINKDGVDILTDEFVTSVHEVEGCLISVDDNILSVVKMSSYLEGYDIDSFTPDDIRDMLRVIGETFEWHKEKTLSYGC